MKIIPEFWSPVKKGISIPKVLEYFIHSFYISGNLEVNIGWVRTNPVTTLCFKSDLLLVWCWWVCRCRYFDRDLDPGLWDLVGRGGFGALGFSQPLWPQALSGAKASALWPQLVYGKERRKKKKGNVHC
jgi:hypothetical protein